MCLLVSLQRYTKALTTIQRSSLVEKPRQKQQERMASLNNDLKSSNYDADPMLCECGVSINSQFTKVDGRVLQPPKFDSLKGTLRYFSLIPAAGGGLLAHVVAYIASSIKVKEDSSVHGKESVILRAYSYKGVLQKQQMP